MFVSSAVPRRLVVSALLLAGVVTIAVAGYVTIEGWSWFDALYMTLTTLTTIGGGEPRPLTQSGRWWTLGVIVFGVGATTYAFLTLAAYLFEGQFGTAVVERRMRARVRNLNGHYVLCGYGRVGREIAAEFQAENVPYVIIDINQSSLAEASAAGHLTVGGNASEADVLREAGIERARGLVTATDSDADNIYVTLSARVLRPSIFIIARANQDDSAARLRLAGANRIISPYAIGGKRMASLAMRPTAVEFIDTILEAGNTNLVIEDLTVAPDSGWPGRPLGDFTGAPSDAIILAIKRGNTMLFRPAEDFALEAGDEIVAAGPRDAIRALEARL